jgi:hypothetical protein
MQKAIRRGDAKLAGYWALELWASGFGQYVWRRLLTVSAEDCWGILTAEVKALHDSYTEINRTTSAKKPKGSMGGVRTLLIALRCMSSFMPISTLLMPSAASSRARHLLAIRCSRVLRRSNDSR